MQLYAFLIGFIITLAGIVISSSILISIGSIGLIGAAILYTINILKIALHQQKLSTTLNN
jgi:Zn-dependent membrane protease YugP